MRLLHKWLGRGVVGSALLLGCNHVETRSTGQPSTPPSGPSQPQVSEPSADTKAGQPTAFIPGNPSPTGDATALSAANPPVTIVPPERMQYTAPPSPAQSVVINQEKPITLDMEMTAAGKEKAPSISGTNSPIQQASYVEKAMIPPVTTTEPSMPPGGPIEKETTQASLATEAPVQPSFVADKEAAPVQPAIAVEKEVAPANEDGKGGQTPQESIGDSKAGPGFGHSPDYSSMTGQLQLVRSQMIWRLRYAPLNGEDRYGGSVTLMGTDLKDLYKDGEWVRVEGQLLRPSTHESNPAFRICIIEPLTGQ